MNGINSKCLEKNFSKMIDNFQHFSILWILMNKFDHDKRNVIDNIAIDVMEQLHANH